MNAQNIGLTFDMGLMLSTVISTFISLGTGLLYPRIHLILLSSEINEPIHCLNWHSIVVEGLTFIMFNGS
jgi:hypothetical protein